MASKRRGAATAVLCVAAAVVAMAVAALGQEVLVYRDGAECYPMAYGPCYTCNAMGVTLTCNEEDDAAPRCVRSTTACEITDDDDNGNYQGVVRVPCIHMPQCSVAYAAAEVDGLMVAAEGPLSVQRLSSDKAGILALDVSEANFLGVLDTLAYRTAEGSVFVKRLLSNGTVVTNAGQCDSGEWCAAPGGLTYSKYTTFYNDSHTDSFGMDGIRMSPFASRLLPGNVESLSASAVASSSTTAVGDGSATNEMLLDIESTPVQISVESLRQFWLQKGYVGVDADQLDGISLQLTRLVNVADMSYDPTQEALSLTLTVDGNARAATNRQCRLLGKYEENTVSRCDFSFEVSFSAGFSYLDSGYFSYLFSSSFSHSQSRRWEADLDDVADAWDAKPAFTLFE